MNAEAAWFVGLDILDYFDKEMDYKSACDDICTYIIGFMFKGLKVSSTLTVSYKSCSGV